MIADPFTEIEEDWQQLYYEGLDENAKIEDRNFELVDELFEARERADRADARSDRLLDVLDTLAQSFLAE